MRHALLLPSLALVLGSVNCHDTVKKTDSGAACKLDADCPTANLCHPSRKVCLPSYPDARLLDPNYDVKDCVPANVYFTFDSAELSPEAKQWLDYDARCIKAQAKAVQVDGYSDAKGDPGYNVELSSKRAMAVKQYLDQNGVTTAEIAGKGEKNPITTGTSEQDYAWNRRVEIRF